MKLAFVFPGQGSQSLGMGKEFYDNFKASKHVFEEVNEVLGQRLDKIIFEGSQEELTLTENTQPALMAVSMSMVRTIEGELGSSLSSKAAVMAGHSLGEYTAYAAGSTFSIAQAAHLLRIRGREMQQASPIGTGAMAAILGLPLEKVEAIAQQAQENDICVVANDNSPGQVVISGNKSAIERAISMATEQGAKRALLLPVSAPFHSPLMAPAMEPMKAALTQLPSVQLPQTPIVSNVLCKVCQSPEALIQSLVDQVVGRVRWRETIEGFQADQVTHIIEIGAGKVLSGLTKRIVPSLSSMSINTPQDMENFFTLLKKGN